MNPPLWLRQAVIYQVFIDRFYQGGNPAHRPGKIPDDKPVFCGGNLQGVAEKLPYLVDLGINTIWLSPFNQGAAYHGYHITNFRKVDERFGGQKGFDLLVKSAKARGLRLIMDFVPNHVHDSHPWFLSAKASKRSRYRNWFYWDRDGDYRKFLDVGELPKLNLDNPDTADEIIGAALFWVDRGIDGLRLDHALGPSMKFWRLFRDSVKRHNEQVALIAEVLFLKFQRHFLPTIQLPDKRLYFFAEQLGFNVLAPTMREYAPFFDGLLDFQFQKLVREFVSAPASQAAMGRLEEKLKSHYDGFPDDCVLLSFLDNHDMNRILWEARQDKGRVRAAAGVQFAQKHPPVIYYGNEVGMSQTISISGPYGDLRCRGMMAWNKPDAGLLKTYKKLIREWKSRCPSK
jgi:glycosidase